MFETREARETAETSWQESLDLMLGAGVDWDSIVKDAQLAVLEIGAAVSEAVAAGGSETNIPF